MLSSQTSRPFRLCIQQKSHAIASLCNSSYSRDSSCPGAHIPKMDPKSQPARGSANSNFSTSNLCFLILEVWSSVIKEKDWALVQPPGPLGSASNRSPLSSVGDLEEDREKTCDTTYEGECILENSPMSTTDPIPTAPEHDLTWEMARFLLNEERDRLCLWQTGFSNDELDQLIKAPSDTPLHAFGVVVVESLLRMGDALLSQTGRM